jgi:hypothetical protein
MPQVELFLLFTARRIALAEGGALWLAPPEYVIVRKLEYYREGRAEKHVTDIRGMLEASDDLIDRRTLWQ